MATMSQPGGIGPRDALRTAQQKQLKTAKQAKDRLRAASSNGAALSQPGGILNLAKERYKSTLKQPRFKPPRKTLPPQGVFIDKMPKLGNPGKPSPVKSQPGFRPGEFDIKQKALADFKLKSRKADLNKARKSDKFKSIQPPRTELR